VDSAMNVQVTKIKNCFSFSTRNPLSGLGCSEQQVPSKSDVVTGQKQQTDQFGKATKIVLVS
jgi:hypothetical protein